jgi:hypothetical protein
MPLYDINSIEDFLLRSRMILLRSTMRIHCSDSEEPPRNWTKDIGSESLSDARRIMTIIDHPGKARPRVPTPNLLPPHPNQSQLPLHILLHKIPNPPLRNLDRLTPVSWVPMERSLRLRKNRGGRKISACIAEVKVMLQRIARNAQVKLPVRPEKLNPFHLLLRSRKNSSQS